MGAFCSFEQEKLQGKAEANAVLEMPIDCIRRVALARFIPIN